MSLNAETAPFVGRGAELAALDEALAAARARSGRIVLLVGPPGIGKSTLADVFMRRARAGGAEVLAGRCFEGPGAPPFWPWTQLLRAFARARDAATLAGDLGSAAADIAAAIPDLHDHLPALSAPTDGGSDEARFRFFDGITQGFVRAGRRRPLVLVIEDLHGADRSSLMLLQYMARELRDACVLIVATLRDVALAREGALASTLGELVREQVAVHLTLAGLDVDEVAELMHGIVGTPPSPALVRDVFDRTEGNPLYLTEIVRHSLDADGSAAPTIPSTVRSAIAATLAHVSPEARATLTLAALFGRDFRVDVVARAAQQPIASVLAHVDEGIAAGVLITQTEPGRYRFGHALFAEALGDGLGETQRVALHRQVAAALAGDGPPPDVLVPEIAHHWFAAGPGGSAAEALDWATLAAERACRVLAHEEAAEWYRRALVALDWTMRDDRPRRAELLLGLGEAEKRIGAAPTAKEAFEQAAALGRMLGSPEIVTRAALGFAPTVTWAQQPAPESPVLQLLEEAIASWHGVDTPLHARALARLAVALFYGDPVRRTVSVEAALAMARRLDDDATLRYALMCGLMSHPGGADVEARLALATELIQRATAARDFEALAVGRLWRCTHLLERGDVAAFDVEHAALTDLAKELRQPDWRWYAALLAAFRHLLAGRFDMAEPAIDHAYAIGQPSLPFAGYAYFVNQTSILRRLQGRPGPIEEYRTLVAMMPDRAFRAVIAGVECDLGRYDEARALLADLASDTTLTARRDIIWAIACMFLAEVCDALDAAAEADVFTAALTPYARYWMPFAEGAPLGPASHALGLLARTRGHLDDAVAHFEHAIMESRRVGALPFLARALTEQAITLRRRATARDVGRTADLLREADQLAVQLEMEGLQRRLAGLAVTTGAADRPTTSAAAPANVLRLEGDYWVLTYDGTTIRLRDTRGLRYLATLLQYPGREVHVAELAATVDVSNPTRAAQTDGMSVRRGFDEDVGGQPDARAAEGYRRRLRELEDEVAEAERDHDLGRLERGRAEQRALEDQLVAAARSRRAGTQTERARLAVTKGIGSALDRIATAHPRLGAHLRATVKRGYFCAYVPDPHHPMRWEP